MKGYYKPSDIRRDGLLKIKKLKERDALTNKKVVIPYSQSSRFEQANPDGE